MDEAPEDEDFARTLYRLLRRDDWLRWLAFGRILLATDNTRKYAPLGPSNDRRQETTSIRFSPAQSRALEWLPASGGWRSGAGRLVAALKSLSNVASNVFEYRAGHYGPRGGWCQQWRLADEGRNWRARVFPESI
jgi:hypothetical protein